MPLPPYSNITFGGSPVHIAEKQGSPTEQWSDAGLQATATLIVPWAHRYLLVDDLLGNARPYPHKSGMYASAASLAPLSTKISADGQCAVYETAEVQVTYGTFETATGPGGPTDVIVYSEELSPNGEFLTLDHTPFVWGAADGDPVKEKEAPGKLILSVDFTQTQYNMASLSISLISKINNTNNAPITAHMLGLTFPTDTLLYAGCSPTRSVTTGGVGKWTVAKKFCYRKDGWNKFWRPGSATVTEGFKEMYRVGSTRYYNFPQTSFADLLI